MISKQIPSLKVPTSLQAESSYFYKGLPGPEHDSCILASWHPGIPQHFMCSYRVISIILCLTRMAYSQVSKRRWPAQSGGWRVPDRWNVIYRDDVVYPVKIRYGRVCRPIRSWSDCHGGFMAVLDRPVCCTGSWSDRDRLGSDTYSR